MKDLNGKTEIYVPQWIPVAERLPEIGDPYMGYSVICCTDAGEVFAALYLGKDARSEFISCDGMMRKGNIIAWMASPVWKEIIKHETSLD